MLETPFGSVDVKLDGNILDYECHEQPLDSTCREVNGRYAIKVSFIPDGKRHSISCIIRDYMASSNDGIESGERLELYSFYRDKTKLSIGMEGDGGYLSNGKRVSQYDYDTAYLENGVQYIILPTTKTVAYVFGVAWIDHVNEENDVQTWYGADPTLFET